MCDTEWISGSVTSPLDSTIQLKEHTASSKWCALASSAEVNVRGLCTIVQGLTHGLKGSWFQRVKNT